MRKLLLKVVRQIFSFYFIFMHKYLVFTLIAVENKTFLSNITRNLQL
jgi:hypothetical protein